MPFGNYGYGGYPGPGGYFSPPMPDQLAQLRQNQAQNPMMAQQPMMQGQMGQPPVLPAQPQGQPASMSGPVFVNGEAGAKGYLVAPGNTVMLIDADPDANTFWMKSADAGGMPSMRTFDYYERTSASKPSISTSQPVPAQAVEYVPLSDFNALSSRCDAIAMELEALKNKPCKCKKEKEEIKDGESVSRND